LQCEIRNYFALAGSLIVNWLVSSTIWYPAGTMKSVGFCVMVRPERRVGHPATFAGFGGKTSLPVIGLRESFRLLSGNAESEIRGERACAILDSAW
jgi:hypothetical protein